MRRLIAGFFIGMMAATFAAAEDTRLRAMSTMDDTRGWEAVGRLDINGEGFCTGALIAPRLVLTAAHCLFDRATGEQIDHATMEFLAGWRNGRASAYRWIRRVVVHPDYVFLGDKAVDRVRNDVALLELHHPIQNTRVTPFATRGFPGKGQQIGIVSYAHDRSEAPSLQEVCGVMGRQDGMLVMSCDVDFGSSGAPVFSFENNEPRIVSVVSAKAEVGGRKVALGTQVEGRLQVLLDELETGGGAFTRAAPRMVPGSARRETGAKFARP